MDIILRRYDGSLESIEHAVTVLDRLGYEEYESLLDDEEATPISENEFSPDEMDEIEQEIEAQLKQCQMRDLKWFTCATVGLIAILTAVNVPLLRFVPHRYFGTIDNLFIIQLWLTGALFITPRLSKMWSTFLSAYAFAQCFILMAAEN